ncbi:IS200/IS605 family transposase [Litoribacter ruber]|uniref:IS200/IS605 family transposase n=1 Tax=Litoribacter ruber TaxID=702568 RepID=UPI001BDAE2EB|nr:IS200/IS605 family transposase [Litoribacter ruber]MBT0810424.1 IS200/IS605 family transposase [Litoribacter ruber]
MSSYKQVFYQIVFSTKRRQHTIPEAHCEELYRYIWGIIKNKDCKLYRVNGISDHIHLFTDLHPKISLAEFIKDIKVSSSIWLKENKNFPLWEGWANGYGAFTYSYRDMDAIINYIINQKEHHKKESFYEEYKRLLIENGVAFKEEYMLG